MITPRCLPRQCSPGIRAKKRSVMFESHWEASEPRRFGPRRQKPFCEASPSKPKLSQKPRRRPRKRSIPSAIFAARQGTRKKKPADLSGAPPQKPSPIFVSLPEPDRQTKQARRSRKGESVEIYAERADSGCP